MNSIKKQMIETLAKQMLAMARPEMEKDPKFALLVQALDGADMSSINLTERFIGGVPCPDRPAFIVDFVHFDQSKHRIIIQ